MHHTKNHSLTWARVSWGAALTAALLLPSRALAVGGPSAGTVTAQTVKLPDGPGSVRGLADDASVSSFSGQVQYAVPIELPAGPGGIQPSLALGYAGELGNGPLGVGWELTMPGVRRSTRLGVPAYDESDVLELVGLGPGGELVPIGGGSLRLEGQGHGYAVEPAGEGFALTAPDGTRYLLGTSRAAQKRAGDRIAYWYLEQVENVAGQTIDYSYRSSQGELYLEAIEWGPWLGEPLADRARALRADLHYEQRDDAVVSFRTGFRVTSSERLDAIEVSSYGGLYRRVSLDYDDSFALSRLSSVEVSGADGTALPVVAFTYAGSSEADRFSVPGMTGWALEQSGTSLFDVDDDGAMDLLQLTASGHRYRRNEGGRFAAAAPIAGAAGVSASSVHLLDLDGDSGADMVAQTPAGWQVYRLERSEHGPPSWTGVGTWNGTRGVALDGVAVADIDGDFRMDVLQTYGRFMRVRFGTEAGLGPATTVMPVDRYRSYIRPGSDATSFPDLNGDGLADAVYLASSRIYTYLGRGDGTFERFRDATYPWPGAVDRGQIRVGDLNRDGISDLALVGADQVQWYAGRSDGSYAAPVVIDAPAGAGADAIVALADANGNGSLDLVWSWTTGTGGFWVLDMAGPTSAGMLVAIDNGLGQSQVFDYQASAQLAFDAADAGHAWSLAMPVSIPVAVGNRRTLASGGPDRSSRLDVRDGIYDRDERRFVGFRSATTITPDPDDGAAPKAILRVTQVYHPGLGEDRALRGQLMSERVEDGLGRVHTETFHELATAPVAGLPDEPRLRRAVVRATDTVEHEVGVEGSSVTVRIEYAYDDQGRLIEQRSLGRTDRTGDEVVVQHDYAQPSERGVRDRVCESRTYALGQAGELALVEHLRMRYGTDTAVAGPCESSNGWEREVSQLLVDVEAAGESRWVVQRATSYDSFGNPRTLYADGVTAQVAYDEHGQRPVAETVHPAADRALTWTATWDYRLGKPVSVTDPSGVTNRAVYDDLGRLAAMATGDRAPHLHYRYDWSGPRPRTDTFAFDGAPDFVPALPEDPLAEWTPTSGWRHTVAVVDSAAAPLFEATRLGVESWLIASYRERGARARTTRLYTPFGWTGQAMAIPGASPAADSPAQTLFYDAFDRITEQALPTGARKRIAYAPLTVQTHSDELAPVRTLLDGLGRTVRTERTIDGTVESVDATYDARGRILAMSLQDGAVTHSFGYDSLGNLISAADPDIGERTMRYDDRGLLVAQTNAAGQSVTYSYDAAARLVRVAPDDGQPVVYHYDDAIDAAAFANTAGRLAWVEEPTGVVQLGYDELGREARRARSIDGRDAAQWTTYAPTGLALAIDFRDGARASMSYDVAGRPTGVTLHIDDQDDRVLWTGTGFDERGNLVEERFGNGLVQTSGYDRDSTLSSTSLARAGQALYAVALERNAYGAITAVGDTDGAGLDHSATFSYDGAARLTGAQLGSGDDAFGFTYAYDGLQNLTSRRQVRGPRVIEGMWGDYAYGGPGFGPRQLGSVRGAADEPVASFGYDAAGRRTAHAGRALHYDALDRLVRVTGLSAGSGDVEHAYGYDGSRVMTRVTDGTVERWFTNGIVERAGVRDYYLRVGDRLVARARRANPTAVADAARIADGASAARLVGLASTGGIALALLLVLALSDTSARRRWERAVAAVALLALSQTMCTPDPASESRALAVIAAVEMLYFHTGVSPGPAVLTRADGTVFEERRYEPFGAPIDAWAEAAGSGAEAAHAIDFAAEPHNGLNKPTDPDTGWSFHGARWMDPGTAQWLSPDPPVKAPDPKFMEQPWALHPYQYVMQNPVLYWDPDGRENRYWRAFKLYHGMKDEGAWLARSLMRHWVIGRGKKYKPSGMSNMWKNKFHPHRNFFAKQPGVQAAVLPIYEKVAKGLSHGDSRKFDSSFTLKNSRENPIVMNTLGSMRNTLHGAHALKFVSLSVSVEKLGENDYRVTFSEAHVQWIDHGGMHPGTTTVQDDGTEIDDAEYVGTGRGFKIEIDFPLGETSYRVQDGNVTLETPASNFSDVKNCPTNVRC